jgi:hypothetical protein
MVNPTNRRMVISWLALLGEGGLVITTTTEQQQKKKKNKNCWYITLFEDFSGEIVNSTKHFGFQWSPSPGNNEMLVFEGGKILFSNGTALLR